MSWYRKSGMLVIEKLITVPARNVKIFALLK